MNQGQAEKLGYAFTGIYGRNANEVKVRREKEFTIEGYKAVVCIIPDDQYNMETHGTGYSIHAERRYFVDKEVQETQAKLYQIPRRRNIAYLAYQKEVADIADDEARLTERMKNLLLEKEGLNKGRKAK